MAFRSQYLILADNVQQIGRGKLNILGTFENFWLPQFPIVLPPFRAIAVLHGENEDDLGKHLFTFRVERPGDAGVAGEAGAQLDVKQTKGGNALAIVRLILTLSGIPIREPGVHHILILVDDVEIARHPLGVLEGAPPAR